MRKLVLAIGLLCMANSLPVERQMPFYVFQKPAASGGGGGTSSTDNFNRSDANPISSPMSDGTSTWTSGPSGWDNIKILSGKATGVDGNWDAGFVATPSFSADQTCTITIGTGTDVGAGVRMNTSTGQGYALIPNGTSTLVLYKAPAFSSIGSFSVSLANGDTIALKVAGSTLTAYHNSTSLGTVTDTTYSSGQPFIALQNDATITLFNATAP